MFAGLTTGFTSIRTSLLNGYGALFFFWVIWKRFGISADAISGSELGLAIEELFINLGSTAQLGALTFGAVVLGSVIDRVAMKSILDRLEVAFRAPRWDEWAQPILKDVKEYGENGSSARSHFYEQYLWEQYESAQSDKAEARFRLNLLVVSLFSSVPLVLWGQAWIVVALGGASFVSALLGFEIGKRWRELAKRMTDRRRSEFNALIAKQTTSIEEVRQEPWDDSAQLWADEAREHVEWAEQQLVRVEEHQFRQGDEGTTWWERLLSGPEPSGASEFNIYDWPGRWDR